MVDGGKHAQILAPSVVQEHLHGYRSLCYFLLEQKLITEPLTFEDALSKEKLMAYLSHVQHNNTAMVKAWRTSMGVFVDLALAHGPLREGDNRKNRRRQAKRLQECQWSSASSIGLVLVEEFTFLHRFCVG